MLLESDRGPSRVATILLDLDTCTRFADRDLKLLLRPIYGTLSAGNPSCRSATESRSSKII